ncbi:MAG: hypothetical protein IJ131_02395, partial [Eggerthellaceae bacterium]|nr:hypothetical protein [Eggerthellaceae bacterium]
MESAGPVEGTLRFGLYDSGSACGAGSVERTLWFRVYGSDPQLGPAVWALQSKHCYLDPLKPHSWSGCRLYVLLLIR